MAAPSAASRGSGVVSKSPFDAGQVLSALASLRLRASTRPPSPRVGRRLRYLRGEPHESHHRSAPLEDPRAGGDPRTRLSPSPRVPDAAPLLPLPPHPGGPIRLVTPGKYGYKSAKSVVRIELAPARPPTLWNQVAP